MDPYTFDKQKAEELLDAQAHIHNHVFNFLNSMALKCAIQLGIPDAIQKHGKPMTHSELANSLPIHPTKAPSLPRLMRLLVDSKFFSITNLDNGEEAFDLTISSQLLLKDHPLTQAPFALAMVDPIFTAPPHHLSSWFQSEDESAFHIAHGKSLWEYAGSVPKFNENFNQAMASDASLVMSVLVTHNEFKSVFEGIESLVDVGGGDGTMAKAILGAFPRLKCMVLDLPHVVEGLRDDGRNLIYVGGDMFEAIPSADAVLLKWVLHDWSDDNCIKILRKCKDAIPSKDQGGKVIIMDMVVNTSKDNEKYAKTQFLLDMQMMSATMRGEERTEVQWKQLFINAGFKDYIIHPILGPRSVIEVYHL